MTTPAALGAAEVRERTQRALPDVSPHDITVNDYLPQTYVEIKVTTGITFAMLQALSEALGTDHINIEPAEDACRYSSWTYDEGSPAKIVAIIFKTKKVEDNLRVPSVTDRGNNK